MRLAGPNEGTACNACAECAALGTALSFCMAQRLTDSRHRDSGKAVNARSLPLRASCLNLELPGRGFPVSDTFSDPQAPAPPCGCMAALRSECYVREQKSIGGPRDLSLRFDSTRCQACTTSRRLCATTPAETRTYFGPLSTTPERKSHDSKLFCLVCNDHVGAILRRHGA